MKKMIALLLLAALIAAILAGCGQQKPEDDSKAQLTAQFTAADEIFTYKQIDPDKTQIIISATGNIDVLHFCAEFEARNPDIQTILVDITGGNLEIVPLVDWVAHGYVPDVVISAATFFNAGQMAQYFEDLSADPVIKNYEAAALQRTAVADKIYWLPGPSNISAMMYNKTLFAQYGWLVPRTFDEFVSLCDQITADTNGGIEPWNPNAKYSNELTVAIEAFTFEELFGGIDNRVWYEDFVEGKATFAGHMEPYIEVLQTLIDHNILREEHFTYSATTRREEFEAGKIAMVNMDIYDADNQQFDFAYMPFPTTKGELGYLCGNYSSYIGLPQKGHSDEQRRAVRAFIEFFSSPQGQRIFIGDSLKSSNVKDTPYNQSGDLAALQPAVDAGHMFSIFNFTDSQGSSRAFMHQAAVDMTAGTVSGAEFITAIDERNKSRSTPAAQQSSEVIASAADEFTILETSFYIADAYRQTAGADIGLIAHNVAYRGNLMRIFPGDLTTMFVNALKPRSLANDSALVKVEMTGRQIIDALNAPAGNEEITDCIYAYSGLKCQVAPWNALGARYLTVKLEDGTEIEMDKPYTVAFWAGTVADEYITSTLETYPGSWEEIMTAKLKADGTLTPAADGRIKLIWN